MRIARCDLRPRASLLLAVTLLSALPSGGCSSPPTSDEVQAEITAANYCAAVSECVNLGSHCPFGCYVLVNQSKSSMISDLIAEYDEGNEGQQCTYSCVMVEGIDCTDGRCVVRPIP